MAEWDSRKAAANLRRRAISFAEAATVLDDWQQHTVVDVDHSVLETRWRTTGLSGLGRVLVVTWTIRRDKVRVISARRAMKRELDGYERSDRNRDR